MLQFYSPRKDPHIDMDLQKGTLWKVIMFWVQPALLRAPSPAGSVESLSLTGKDTS